MPLNAVREQIIELLEWMYPDLAALHREADGFTAALDRRPAA